MNNHNELVKQKIIQDIKLRRVKGPYLTPPLANFICSPLGVVPKKTPNTFRIIHDLSFPKRGQSVNSAIPYENATVALETFDHVARLVLQSGRGSLVAKADIEEAFKIIPISPKDFHKLGFSFNNCFYFGTVLPFGASSSVAIFESFAQALQWVLQHKLGVLRVSHIIDDFIFVGRKQTNECQIALDTFISLSNDLGVPIKHAKTVFPTTSIEVHGINLNTDTLSASLPPDKICALKVLLAKYRHCRKVSLKTLQSILGHLNFACKVIKPGRCFLRRLYDLTVGKTNPNHLIKLTKECRADLQLWNTFLEKYNGCTLLTNDRFVTSISLKLFTDASGSKGFGCTHMNSWTYGEFPTSAKCHHINVLELYPIALAVSLFGQTWTNKNILFTCDNLSVVFCLNKQSSKDSVMMRLIRIIVLKSLQHNFCFRAKHIKTTENTVCDLLSRLQVQQAREAAPYLDPQPLPIPLDLSPLTLLK